MKQSEKLSPAVNERDRKGYRQKFNEYIERLGSFFKPPIQNEEDLGKEVNCLELVSDIIPDLTIENVEKLAAVLAKESGSSLVDPKLNTIIRRFHRVRYLP
mmetsp:Transcript_9419/g.8917  ORF Transcript_9419/g.8917 Transcript_9419/m.8917 type:complete len:101 (+) Transcript_9419:1397-1699(+)